MSVHEERRGEIDDVLTAFHYQLNNFSQIIRHTFSPRGVGDIHTANKLQGITMTFVSKIYVWGRFTHKHKFFPTDHCIYRVLL